MSTKSMDVFSLRDSVVGEYRKFATSFTTIHATDIRRQVEAIYAEGRFWPESLIHLSTCSATSSSLKRFQTFEASHGRSKVSDHAGKRSANQDGARPLRWHHSQCGSRAGTSCPEPYAASENSPPTRNPSTCVSALRNLSQSTSRSSSLASRTTLRTNWASSHDKPRRTSLSVTSWSGYSRRRA